VPVLLMTGALLGALSGFPPLSSIAAVALPLLAATLFLKHDGLTWRELYAGRRLSWKQIAGYTLVAMVLASLGAYAIIWVLQNLLGFPPTDVSGFVFLLTGNPVMYFWYVIPVAWGSAAIGEELLCRGYLLYRLEELTGTWVAIVLQAFIFSLAHFYQGITGFVGIFVLALVFGAIYFRSGRNLLPLILAHGLIDTMAITAIYLGRTDLLIGT